MVTQLTHFARSEKGATAIEYSMIACFIFLAIVASVSALGGNLVTAYNKVGNLF